MAIQAPSNASLETPGDTHAEQQPRRNGLQDWLITGGSLLVIAALAVGALTTYRQPAAPYGERAAFLFPLLILLVELGARWLAYRALFQGKRPGDFQTLYLASERELSLPHITLPLYLACAV